MSDASAPAVVARGLGPATPQSIAWYSKDPTTIRSFSATFDVEAEDSIVQADFAVTPQDTLVLDGGGINGAEVWALLAGGNSGSVYQVAIWATFASGRRQLRTLGMQVLALAPAYAVPPAAITVNGFPITVNGEPLTVNAAPSPDVSIAGFTLTIGGAPVAIA